MTNTKKILLGLFGLSVLFHLLGANPSEKTEAVKKEAVTSETPEQKAEQLQKKVEQLQESRRQGLAWAAKTSIKDAARNPDSVSFSFVGVNKDASTVCVEYRAQNGFGGMNQEYIAFHNGKAGKSAEFWNRNCLGKLYRF